MARKLLILTAILMAFAAAAVYFYFFVGPAGKRVFAKVRVGDSEKHLVSLLASTRRAPKYVIELCCALGWESAPV